MKNKSLFSRAMIIVIVALVCLTLTITVALTLGSIGGDIFNFAKLNLSNVIPVMLIGGFVSCVIVGILVLVLAKDILIKIKDHLFKEKDGGNRK